MKSYKLIIFDLDGTLVNSMYDVGDAMNHAYRSLGKPEIPYSQIPSMVGSGIKQLLKDGFGDDVDIEQLLDVFYTYYDAHFVDKTRPYDQVIGGLEAMKDIKKAVYSNKPHRYTIGIVEQLALKKHFDWVQGAQPELYARKPSPDGVQLILDTLQIAPEETLFVGDSTHDIHAGRAAGTDTCAVTYGYRSKEVLLAEKPDFMVDNFMDIPKIIDGTI